MINLSGLSKCVIIFIILTVSCDIVFFPAKFSQSFRGIDEITPIHSYHSLNNIRQLIKIINC